eukprot:TRINITY_DN5476_c0_g1_i3.p2 TRINITY_DN5476_c0_g1~~TRINITY_DN5476_c0_g1_i3.p2  ORF type:complete len:142 (-),score=4.43 TRINITY_DN5476_c0_g1_i3:483-908(-)
MSLQDLVGEQALATGLLIAPKDQLGTIQTSIDLMNPTNQIINLFTQDLPVIPAGPLHLDLHIRPKHPLGIQPLPLHILLIDQQPHIQLPMLQQGIQLLQLQPHIHSELPPIQLLLQLDTPQQLIHQHIQNIPRTSWLMRKR